MKNAGDKFKLKNSDEVPRQKMGTNKMCTSGNEFAKMHEIKI